MERLAGIEAGSECERLLPLVSALADGEASAEELRELRPHLRTCLTCRARLREFRAAPKRVAALMPPVAVATQGDPVGPIRSALESLVGSFGERAHAAAELATGQKVAAVAATAAVAAGGGAGVKEVAVADHPNPRPQHARPKPAPAEAPTTDPNPVAPTVAPKPVAPTPPPRPAQPPQPKPPPDPATEFAPGSASAPAPSPAPSTSTRPAGGSPSSGGAGAGEFGP